MDFEEIKRRLSALDTACICDANMEEGVSLLDMLNFEEHSAKVGAGKESELKFIV